MSSRTLLILLAGAAASVGQESSATLENAFNTPEDVTRGERTFLSQCASCHGRDGRGTSAAPDLSTGQFRRAASDEGLYNIIAKGIPGTTMPAFALNPSPTWQVVAYIRYLARERNAQAPPGSQGRGASLFETRCKGCHQSWAPALGNIGRRRSLDDLRSSILNPGKDVHDAYWRVRLTMRDGSTAQGARLNEDTFTVQIRDAKGALRTYDRGNIAKLEYDRTSPMPSFQGKLSDAEVNDIVAYLSTLEAQ